MLTITDKVIEWLHVEQTFIPLFTHPLDETLSDETVASRGRPGSATNTHSCSRIRSVPSNLRSSAHMGPRGLGQFYQKYTEAYGIPILGRNLYMFSE